MSKANGTDGSLLSSLPWTLVALGVSVLPHLPYLPVWVVAALILSASARMVIEQRRKHLPPAWVRVSLAVICFIAILATYENITGVGPGSALLIVMAAMKLLETRKRRDQFVLLFISVFLVMSALLREQFIWSLPYMIVATLVIFTGWMRMAAGPRASWKQNFWNTSRLMAMAAPMMIVMWVFFPRLSSPFWAVPIDTSRGQSGLSETMSPGDISDLSLSDATAFRVKFHDRIPDRRDLYFRGLVLHRFNGRTWTGSDGSADRRLQPPIEYSGESVSYTITMEPTARHWVFALDLPWEWTLRDTVMLQEQQLASRRPIDQRVSFQARSYTDYKLDPSRQARNNDYYTWLGRANNKRTIELAQAMRAEAGSDRQYIGDVLRMFNQQEFFYTLQPPGLGSNPVDQFMFETRQGFCEHYASAFAVMMRAAGLPARVILGYQGGEFNAIGGHLIVRQSDAHAWNEVWLPDDGWVRFDPTGAVAPERIEAGVSGALQDGIGATWGFASQSMFLHNLTLAWDALNAKWDEWILGYGPENQTSFMQWLGMDDPDWRSMILTMLAIVVSIVAAVSLMLALRYRPPRRDKAARLYRQFVNKTGVELATGETPLHFGARIVATRDLSASDVEKITRSYLDARYGTGGEEALNDLKSALEKMAA